LIDKEKFYSRKELAGGGEMFVEARPVVKFLKWFLPLFGAILVGVYGIGVKTEKYIAGVDSAITLEKGDARYVLQHEDQIKHDQITSCISEIKTDVRQTKETVNAMQVQLGRIEGKLSANNRAPGAHP